MNKKQTASALFITAVVGFAAVFVKGSEAAIAELHPEIDPKILRKAHRQFLKDTLTDRTTIDETKATDEELDAYFMEHYINPII